MNNPTVMAWLLDAVTIIGFAMLAACLVYGLLLLTLPGAALGLSATLNRHYSSRRAMRPLEIPRVTEPFFYRHHRLVAALLLAGVIAFFLLYAFGYPGDTVLAAVARASGTALATAAVDTVEWFLLSANLLIGVFALVMFFRPSLLKPLETRANRWISTRRRLREAEREHEPVDRYFSRHPRIAGLLVLLGAGYVGISLLVAMA